MQKCGIGTGRKDEPDMLRNPGAATGSVMLLADPAATVADRCRAAQKRQQHDEHHQEHDPFAQLHSEIIFGFSLFFEYFRAYNSGP